MTIVNILGRKLYEMLRAKLTDGRTADKTDYRADGKNVYNVFFDKDNDDALRLFAIR